MQEGNQRRDRSAKVADKLSAAAQLANAATLEVSHTFDSCRFMLLTYGLKFDGMKASSRLMPPQLNGAGTICDGLMKVGYPT